MQWKNGSQTLHWADARPAPASMSASHNTDRVRFALDTGMVLLLGGESPGAAPKGIAASVPGAMPRRSALPAPAAVHARDGPSPASTAAPGSAPGARASVDQRPAQLGGPDRLGVLAGAERRIHHPRPALEACDARLEADDVPLVDRRREPERDLRASGGRGVVLAQGAVGLAQVDSAPEPDAPTPRVA